MLLDSPKKRTERRKEGKRSVDGEEGMQDLGAGHDEMMRVWDLKLQNAVLQCRFFNILIRILDLTIKSTMSRNDAS
ncbi:hypothetical protein C2857_006619 [Epichloe festucae Fl1]|uniref:Uncharacterized protein n=1 Tax=Epichloe festucae (strain Fl1) TaxID=877507 RepID=A0A7S9PW01_EPIFF|nr:hypothetical protein C2857_006619 [Epichloe festucae Fl1]